VLLGWQGAAGGLYVSPAALCATGVYIVTRIVP
jgi:hypothetical protein